MFLNLGDTYYLKKEYEQALRCFDLSYKMCQETKDEHQRSILYCSYGEVFLEMKDYEKAASYADKASELAKKLSLTSEYLPLLLLKANIALANQSSEVERICEEGLRLAETSKLHNKKREFYLVLAGYYEQTGDQEAFRKQTENMYRLQCSLQRR